MQKKGWLYNGFVFLVVALVLIPLLLVACGEGEVLQLADGSTWRLTRVYFSDVVGSTEVGQRVEVIPGYVFLCIDVERISQGSSTFFSVEWEDVYVIDNQGDEHPLACLEGAMKDACLAFGVPEDSHGFTLYFLDTPPIELGK